MQDWSCFKEDIWLIFILNKLRKWNRNKIIEVLGYEKPIIHILYKMYIFKTWATLKLQK